MVITTEGLNTAAEKMAALITVGQWGTGTSNPSITDTALETPVAATSLALSSTVVGNTIQFTHIVNTSTGNGNVLTEYELSYATGENFNRSVGGAINKDSSVSLTTISQITMLRGN